MADEGPRPKAFDPNYERYKKSKREEDRFAERLGGKRLPRSGGVRWSRDPQSDTLGGDVKTSDLLIEHKRVEPHTGSIKVKRGWLKKVTEGASRANRIPALGITFENPNGHAQDWLMLPLEIIENLFGKLKDEGQE